MDVRVERQLSSNTALRVGYVGSHGYHGFVSVDPNDSGANVSERDLYFGRQSRHAREHVPQGALYIPVRRRGRIRIWARASSGTPRATAATTPCRSIDPSLVKRSAVPRAIHVLEKPGYELRAYRRAGSNESQMVMNRNDLPPTMDLRRLTCGQQASISASYLLPFGEAQR